MKSEEEEEEEKEPKCCICIEPLCRTNDMCITKCGHVFHTSCIVKCNGTCPLCRTNLSLTTKELRPVAVVSPSLSLAMNELSTALSSVWRRLPKLSNIFGTTTATTTNVDLTVIDENLNIIQIPNYKYKIVSIRDHRVLNLNGEQGMYVCIQLRNVADNIWIASNCIKDTRVYQKYARDHHITVE
jgi:hypothetical protein